MFFGLFSKSSKNPTEEIKEVVNLLIKSMDTNKKDKTLLDSNIYI